MRSIARCEGNKFQQIALDTRALYLNLNMRSFIQFFILPDFNMKMQPISSHKPMSSFHIKIYNLQLKVNLLLLHLWVLSHPGPDNCNKSYQFENNMKMI